MNPDLQVRMMTEMLESYDREIQSLEGSINEAEEDLENTRWVWVGGRKGAKGRKGGCWVWRCTHV